MLLDLVPCVDDGNWPAERHAVIRDKVKRNYMLGCLKAFLKSGFQRAFYDLGKVGY